MKKVCYLVASGEYENIHIFTNEEQAEKYKKSLRKQLAEYYADKDYGTCNRPFIEEHILDPEEEDWPWIFP